MWFALACVQTTKKAAFALQKKRLKNRRAVPIIQRPQPFWLDVLMTQLAIASPCVRVCALDDGQVCVGCGRTLAEIVAWTQLSPVEQRAVCERAERRRAAANEPTRP
jgi:uncharacterized protein